MDFVNGVGTSLQHGFTEIQIEIIYWLWVNGFMRKHAIYYFSAFITGMCIMIIELSAARLMAPYFGNSLYVWTNIIGLVMVALAIGYFLGGRLADKEPRRELYFALIFITGLWSLFIPFFSPILFQELSAGFTNLALTVKWGSFFAVVFLFVIPMVLLGMMVPFTVKLVIQKISEMGKESGQISAVSALGSLIGSFLPAFVLMPLLGTSKTFIFTGILLILLAALGLRKWWVFILATLACSLFWLVSPVYANSALIYSEDSPYGYIFVTEDSHGVRRLHVDNPLGTQSIYDSESIIPSSKYYYSYFGVLPTMVQNPKSVLILGHAGGSFTHILNAYYPDLEITGIELDPAVTRIAEEYFALDEALVTLVHADARTYLQATKETYDLIFIDTYHASNIPAHLATQGFFNAAAEKLNFGGIVALNAASNEGLFLESLSASFASQFEFAARLKIPDSYNFMILGSDNAFEFYSNIPDDLAAKKEYFIKWLKPISLKDNVSIFTDEKMSEIEILTEQMHMDLMQNFKRD